MDVTLQWATFFDAADQAGQSRLWGGIHIAHDDYVGRRTGSQVGLWAVARARRFYDGSESPLVDPSVNLDDEIAEPLPEWLGDLPFEAIGNHLRSPLSRHRAHAPQHLDHALGRWPHRVCPSPIHRRDDPHAHTVHVEMGEGLARVTEELVLTSLTQGLRMSLPISDRGVLTGLEVCEGRRCMPGITVAETSEVFDAARFAYREEGAPALAMAFETRGIISLHLAGSDVGTPRVRITWTAPTETLSGQERLVLPERRDGIDLVLTSATLEGLALQGDPLERHLPAHTRGVLSGVIASHAPELISGVVGESESAQTWVRFSPAAVPLEVRDVVVLLDASPGMWPREEEALRVLSLVLHALPDGSEAHLIALARHTRELASGPVESLRAQAFSLPRDLGPSTSVVASEEALVALDAALHSPRIVWIGDGGMDWSTADQEALARLRHTWP